MIIVNDPVFNTDPEQPQILHGVLDPYVDYGLAEMVAMPVGTLYISRAAQVGDPCGTTFSAGCLFLKSGTAGSICAPLGSRSDWCKLGCHGLLLGTVAPNTESPFCESEMGQIYQRTIDSCVLHYIKTGSECDSPWISLSRGLSYEQTVTPVGVTDNECLCALPIGAFVDVPNVGTWFKAANNCDGNDWRPLMPDVTNLEDMRIVTHVADPPNAGIPTYDVATRTLNIPPHVVAQLRYNASISGAITVAAGVTQAVDFDTVDIDTSGKTMADIATNMVTIPHDGFYRVSVSATFQNKAASYRWRIRSTLNGADLNTYLYDTQTIAEQATTHGTDTVGVPLTGGDLIGVQIGNLDATSSDHRSVHLLVEQLGA